MTQKNLLSSNKLKHTDLGLKSAKNEVDPVVTSERLGCWFLATIALMGLSLWLCWLIHPLTYILAVCIFFSAWSVLVMKIAPVPPMPEKKRVRIVIDSREDDTWLTI